MNQNAIERITSSFRQIPKVEAVLCRIGREFQEEEYSLNLLEKKFETFLKAGYFGERGSASFDKGGGRAYNTGSAEVGNDRSQITIFRF